MAEGQIDVHAELLRQDEELAELEAALRRLDRIDVPPSFFAELEEACAVSAPTPLPSFFPAGIRA